MNIKFADCCVIQASSCVGAVFWTAAWSPADFEVEMIVKKRKSVALAVNHLVTKDMPWPPISKPGE